MIRNLLSVCDYATCNAPLVRQDSIISVAEASVRWNVLEWLQKAAYNEVQQTKNRIGKFGFTIPIEGVSVPFDLDIDFSEADFKKLQEHIKSGHIEHFSDEKFNLFIQNSYGESALKAWSECMQNMIIACGTGLHLMQVKYEGYDTIIRIRYVPEKNGDPYPIVKEDLFVPKNAVCQVGCLKKGEEITDEHLILITRSNDEQGTIMLLTDRGDIEVRLAPPPPPPPDGDGDGIPDSEDKYPKDPTNNPIFISESEKRAAIKGLYDYFIKEWIKEYHDLGPQGICRVEEFNVEGTKVHLKILFRFGWFCGFARVMSDGYLIDTVDLANLESLNNRDASVTIRKPYDICITQNGDRYEEMTLYIPLRGIADEILSKVHNNP